MAIVNSLNCHKPFSASAHPPNPNFSSIKFHPQNQRQVSTFYVPAKTISRRRRRLTINGCLKDSEENTAVQGKEVDNIGVRAALSMLRFYKREISPIIPKSCRYVPTCSEYSMEAYKKYGVVKGTILTAWRLCRCNPLGGSGFDPPRWFDEKSPLEE
ncbi:hypothetical protein SLE2022_103940 [Rubroshorea leprosula]